MATINGTSGNDSLIGTTGDDSIFGLDGSDTLRGGNGNDSLYGGIGLDDWLFGDAGNDYIADSGSALMVGGSGNDTLDGTSNGSEDDFSDVAYSMDGGTLGVTVNLATGIAIDTYGNTDTLIDIEGVIATNQADSLTGSSENNIFRGLGGNDTINGGGGFDEAHYALDAGAGGTAGVVVNLITGFATDGFGNTDTLISIENVRGTNSADSLTGNADSNRFRPLGGNDTIIGGAGIDQIDYSQDARYGGLAGVTVNLSTGSATDGSGGIDSFSEIENAIGTNSADAITGDSANNKLEGSGGNDTLSGSDGNDTLRGGDGNDMLFAENGDDELRGDLGNDTIDGGAGSDNIWYGGASSSINANLATGVVVGGEGSDTLISIENIEGTNFADTIVGSSGDNYMRGDADAFSPPAVGPTGDLLSAGAGFDVIDYRDDPSAVTINLQIERGVDGHGGQDSIEGFEEARGSAYNDLIIGSTNLYYERFEGRAGDDTIDGGLITDTLNADNANQVSYRNASAAVTVNLATGAASGGAGNDVLFNFNQVRGSGYNDTLIGSDRTDVSETFEGREGDDSIDGAGGFDVVRYDNATGAITASLVSGTASGANNGNDTFTNVEGFIGSAFNDVLIGGLAVNGINAASDVLREFFRGGAGNDTIDGGQGFDFSDYTSSTANVIVTLNDTLDGSASDGFGGTDVLRNIEGVRGSAFSDSLTGSNTAVFESFEGREGNDTINGLGGTDSANYFSARAGTQVNLTTGVASDGYGSTDTLSNIEDVRGSRDFNDSITGSTGANKLEGLGGNDTLDGVDGNDTLDGGDGNDSLVGGLGFDSLVGGAGDDTLRGGDQADTVLGGSGNDSLSGGKGFDSLDGGVGNDTLIGYLGNDTLLGFDGFDLLDGGDGNDSLNGGINADTLIGGIGDDILAGGQGTDNLDGGDGNDTLIGGLGTDVLTGGIGADHFVFKHVLDGAINIDTFTDFQSGVDVMELSASIFTAYAGQIGSTVGTSANLTYNATTGVLAYDADGAGSGAAVTFAVVGSSSHPASLGNDFLIVA